MQPLMPMEKWTLQLAILICNTALVLIFVLFVYQLILLPVFLSSREHFCKSFKLVEA